MKILYHGHEMKMRADLLPQAVVIRESGDDAPAAQAPAGSQVPLMTLPESARTAAAQRSKVRGHAMPPGTGPAGQTCGGCAHLARVRHAKTYLKCGLMKAKWTGGGGTDVRAKDPACGKWSAQA